MKRLAHQMAYWGTGVAVAASVVAVGPAAHAVRTQHKVMIIADHFSGQPAISYFGSEDPDTISVSVGDDDIVFTAANASSVTIDNSNYSTYDCSHTSSTTITCPSHVQTPTNLLKVESVAIVTWDGADTITASGQGSVYGTSGFRPIQLSIGSWEGDDTITAGGYSRVTAGDGADTITSGAGPAAGSGSFYKDTIDAGDGDDTIRSSTPDPDQVNDPDQITCRGGDDTVYKDGTDTLIDPANCEHLY
ncbi:hypothetical protein GCM10027589_48800 [Actinocorallia lasiicapitis]